MYKKTYCISTALHTKKAVPTDTAPTFQKQTSESFSCHFRHFKFQVVSVTDITS